MEITSFKKITDKNNLDIINTNNSLLGGYSKFRIPSLEDINYYNTNVVPELMIKIWNEQNNKFSVPQIENSNILLIRSQVVAGMNYNAIVSIIFNEITKGVTTEYYEISYFVPLN